MTFEDLSHINNFLKKIEIYYSKNFNFKDIYNELLINKIFYKDYVLLIELLKKAIEEICNSLKINTKIILASSLKNINFKGQERIINIVEELRGAKYVNFIGGSKMYEQNVFEKKKIELCCLKSDLSDVN